VRGVVHVVEQINVGKPHWIFAEVIDVLPVAHRQVRFPPQPMRVSGAVTLFEQVVAEACSHITMSRLKLIRYASDSIGPPLPPSILTGFRTTPRRSSKAA
jgi:hypothetical protein